MLLMLKSKRPNKLDYILRNTKANSQRRS